MPQLSPIALNDRSTPAVLHTFKPRDVTSGVATLVESTGVPIADRRITVSNVRTGNGRSKVTIKLALPVVADQVVNGVSQPTVIRTAYVETTFSFDQASSKAERGMASEFMAGLLMGEYSENADPIRPVIEDLESLY